MNTRQWAQGSASGRCKKFYQFIWELFQCVDKEGIKAPLVFLSSHSTGRAWTRLQIDALKFPNLSVCSYKGKASLRYKPTRSGTNHRNLVLLLLLLLPSPFISLVGAWGFEKPQKILSIQKRLPPLKAKNIPITNHFLSVLSPPRSVLKMKRIWFWKEDIHSVCALGWIICWTASYGPGQTGAKELVGFGERASTRGQQGAEEEGQGAESRGWIHRRRTVASPGAASPAAGNPLFCSRFRALGTRNVWRSGAPERSLSICAADFPDPLPEGEVFHLCRKLVSQNHGKFARSFSHLAVSPGCLRFLFLKN